MVFHLLFVLYPLAGWLIAVFTFVTPLRMRAWVKVAVSILLLAGALKFAFYSGIGGNMFIPEISRTAFACWSFAFSAVMLLSGFAIALWVARWTRAAVRHVSKLVGSRVPRDRGRSGTLAPTIASVVPSRPAGHDDPIAPSKSAKRPDGGWEWPCASRREFVSGAFAAAAAGIAAYGMHEGLRIPSVERVEIGFPDLPEEFDGYRIVQISDTHISSALPGSRTKEVVDIVNSLKGDLVCVTGDIVDGNVEDRLADVRPLAEIKSVDGVFGCAGNHEFYSGYEMWRPRFKEFGISMLDNSSVQIRRGGGEITLGGVVDPVCGYCKPAKAFAKAPQDGFRILLMHRPIGTYENAALGVRLQLSGHTHGGGVNFFRPIVAPHNEGHIRGLYEEHGMKLYVNAGTGQWAGFPMRLGNPSEITLITLKKEKA